MREEQISLLTEKKQELLAKENSNTEGLSNETKTAFRSSGVAHLLAVSGLHVGIIVAIFRKLLKKMKKHLWLKLIIICPLLLVYMYICNFAYSIIRASIMAIILLTILVMSGIKRLLIVVSMFCQHHE